jgi:N-acetylglutamate synthase-like GNAT family acetyltransferase
MDVRPYQSSDRGACLAVFDSLTPGLLDSAALPTFEAWLDRALKNVAGPYFVMEHEASVVGCGGYSFSPDGTAATLQWGMVHRDSQRMGLGRFLLLYRIREIGKAGTAGLVFAHPPPASAGFFEKQGFRINAIEKDAVELIKKLTVCP